MVLIHKKTFDVYTRIVGEEYNEDDYFECDELMAPIICNLNEKGYTTVNCCSGHAYPERQKTPDGEISYLYDNFYISFAEKYEFDSDIFPEDAYMDNNVLRIAIVTMTDIVEERRDAILKACDDVWKWSIKMPSLEEKKKEILMNEVTKFFDYCEDNEFDPEDEKSLFRYSMELAYLNGFRAEQNQQLIDEIKLYLYNLRHNPRANF